MTDSNKREVAQTEAANRVTGKFLCAGGGHYVRGTPIRIGGRRFCQRCADAKRQSRQKTVKQSLPPENKT